MFGSIEFPYRPKAGKMLAGMAFFAIGAILLRNEALTNGRGLIIDGILRLDVTEATHFYWAMAAVCLGFVIVGAVVTLSSLFGGASLRLTESDLLVPQGLLFRVRTIPFNTILNTQILQIRTGGPITGRHTQFLKIRAASGSVSINQSWLPDGAFEKVCAHVAERAQAQQAGAATDRHTSLPGKAVAHQTPPTGLPGKATDRRSASPGKSFGRRQ